MRIVTGFCLLSALLCADASAVDWTQAPLTEDGACEFRAAPWHSSWWAKHNISTVQEAEATAIRQARAKCKDGMTLLLTDASSGRPQITKAAMNVARALCRAQDIETTQRKAFDDVVMNDFRCPISKIGAAGSGADRPPN
ncbi:MAG TPA: hypothetical protein PKV98_01575 [Burkholderiaceae bacterium]|nr:hypothetical protein [Burkholderiaceae bacterium]